MSKHGGKEATWGDRVVGALLLGLFVALPAQAADIEIVTARFCDLPPGVPFYVYNSGMEREDDAVAARIADGLRRKGFEVLDHGPAPEKDALLLSFERDRFVPARPDDRSGFGLEVHGASGSGVSARIVVPKLQKDYLFGPDMPASPPGPVLTLDIRIDLGAARRVWLGRATAPLGHRAPGELEGEMADLLVNALPNPPDDKCVAPPE